jgi:phage terminase Nu1 subunit (DNA packaging protein)
MQSDVERLVGEQVVSDITGIKIRTLRKWRLQGRGPSVKRIEGRLVRYSLRDVHEWMRDQPRFRTERSQQEMVPADPSPARRRANRQPSLHSAAGSEVAR